MQNDDNILYAHSDLEYKALAAMFDYSETGIHLCGDINLENGTSILLDKYIPFSDEDKVVESYQKVVEMRELTSEEFEKVSKVKLIWKKVFDVFFRGKKSNVYYFAFLVSLFGIDVATDNMLGAIFMVALMFIYNSPIKFYKEVKKILAKEEKCEELKQYLIDNNLLSAYCSNEDQLEVSLYLKPTISQH